MTLGGALGTLRDRAWLRTATGTLTWAQLMLCISYTPPSSSITGTLTWAQLMPCISHTPPSILHHRHPNLGSASSAVSEHNFCKTLAQRLSLDYGTFGSNPEVLFGLHSRNSVFTVWKKIGYGRPLFGVSSETM